MNEKKIPSPGPAHRKAVQHYLYTATDSEAVHTLCQEILYLRARLSQTKRWLRAANWATARMSLVTERMARQVAYYRQNVNDYRKSSDDLYRRNREWAQSYSELQCKCDLLEDELQTLKERRHA